MLELMERDYCTMDDFDLEGKTVLLRAEFNSPLGPEGEILDDKRIRESVPTIKELEDAKVVLLAHQGRPGKKDFTTMERHARQLQRYVKQDVRYVDDIFGSHARSAIAGLEPGQVLMLENVRFYSEELLGLSPEAASRTIMVRKLAPLAQAFINDAFGAAHRSQCSLVGFTPVLPSGAGRLMQKEIDSLTEALKGGGEVVYVLGGAKVDDSIGVAKHVLEKGIASKVLVTGVVASVFLAASGIDIGGPNMDFLDKSGAMGELPLAKGILQKFGDKVVMPHDLAVNKDGKRLEISVRQLPTSFAISDIGHETIASFSDIVRHAERVILKGPAGVFEDPEFSAGTKEMLTAASNAKFSVVCGGHSAVLVDRLGLEDKFTHVSTGGGAAIDFLSGKPMPAIDALKAAKKRMMELISVRPH
ncbi:3-phosphoglycerate kinase [Methanocella conradii HZ254]|uniref:Phosphoglycerate kinase n=1 Tax=Methanocella conradii (strain DSM 24694 / JCM 17849 / CGMCC 1.5162 / HZ254) TaxID=1041930 RepID=H8I4C5_METCZ|nr:phosphoglycerate kinase [Methanocella conradii]AFC99682.1 3-phosphoglycerate kinase [Methanocella conradii HZ254]